MNIVEILKEHFEDHMTDEIAEKIQTSFEFAVSEKVSQEKEKLEESLQTEYDKKLEEGLTDLEEKLDVYIDKANEELIDENLKNIESKAKVELAENIVDGVIKVIKENNLEIAIEDKEIIKQLEEEKAELKKSLDDSVNSITENKKEIFEYEKAIAVMKMTNDLTETQKEKVVNMVEHVTIKDIEEFKEKLKTSIELVTEKDETDDNKDDVLDENFDDPKKSELDEYIPLWTKK